MRLALTLCLLLLCWGCQPKSPPPDSTVSPTSTPTDSESPSDFENDDLPKLGKHLFEQSYERMPLLKGKMHCSSCHLQGGTTAGAASLVGVSSVFPEYSPRAGREIDLAERVNECVERSLNGPALGVDSQEMRALLAYLEVIKADPIPPRGLEPLSPASETPDSQRGQALYATHCLACHKADGSGTFERESYVYPPLWGESSFTVGSEMARAEKLAGFIFVKMPLGRGTSLNSQEAHDIAAYIVAQPRPDYPKAAQDYPEGGAPADLPYQPAGTSPE